MVTTLNKTINTISVIFSYYFKTRYKFVVFSLWMSYLNELLEWKLTLSLSFNKIYFLKLSGQGPFKTINILISTYFISFNNAAFLTVPYNIHVQCSICCLTTLSNKSRWHWRFKNHSLVTCTNLWCKHIIIEFRLIGEILMWSQMTELISVSVWRKEDQAPISI